MASGQPVTTDVKCGCHPGADRNVALLTRCDVVMRSTAEPTSVLASHRGTVRGSGAPMASASNCICRLRVTGTSSLTLYTPAGAVSDAATAVGKAVAEKALAAGIKEVRFDRGHLKYHGRVAALADAAREAGLKF